MSEYVISCKSSVDADDQIHILVMLDHNSRITEVCGVQRGAHGFTASELCGRKVSEFIHEEIPEHLLNTCKQMFRAGHAWRGAVKCRTKAGGHCWWDVYLSPRGQTGLPEGAWLTLSPCEPQVIERAQQVYRIDKKALRKPRPYPTLFIFMALVSLLVAFLSNAVSALVLTMLLGLSLSLTALLLGRFSLDGTALLRNTRPENIDPLMCYVYTGGSNTSCIAAYTLALRDRENLSLAAWVSHRCDMLESATRHQQSRIARVDTAIYQQQQQTQLIRHSLRGLLDDQHRITCAATRSLQLILASQQDAIQSRITFHQLGQVHRQHLGRLQRIHNHLKTLVGHHHQIIGLIDKLSETTEEMHFVAHRHPAGIEAHRTLVPDTQDLHQLAKSASLSLQDLHRTTRQWSLTVRDLMLEIEASMQDAQQHFAFVHDGDAAFQAIINVMSRLTSLLSDIEGAVHQQSILRAAVIRHTDVLEEHIICAAQTTQDIGAGIERTRRQLDNLRLLPQGTTH